MLLLLIDGVVMDVEVICEVVVCVLNLFMLVIIVGVGGVDFEVMEQLDVDGGFLYICFGQVVVCDIVQFVFYCWFQNVFWEVLVQIVFVEVFI